MKVYLSTAPMSAEIEALLKDPDAARRLLLGIAEGGYEQDLVIETNQGTLNVSSSSVSVAAPPNISRQAPAKP